MGGYALFSRVGNFGSAQTANLIEIILNIFGRDYKEVGLRLVALLLFSTPAVYFGKYIGRFD